MQPFCFWLKSLFGVVAEQIKGKIATTPFISAKCEELKKKHFFAFVNAHMCFTVLQRNVEFVFPGATGV